MLATFACTKPEIQFNNAYNGDNATNVKTVDTFAVKLSTVFLDSFSTSGTHVQLLGRYKDPYLGVLTSRSYNDIGGPNPLPTLTNYSIYDSIELIMRINRTYYGDTTQVQRFLVSQLTEVMNLPGTQTAFYNNNSIPYNPAILGSTDIQINPRAGLTTQRIGDTVKIKMPDSMGHELYDLLYRQSDTLKNLSIFRGYFKGLTVYPDTTMAGAVYGFKDSMFLRIYYHDPGQVVTQKSVDFHVVNFPNQFNHITVDRTGTAVEKISRANPELPSTSTGNQVFLQPITSLYVKMLFPTITNLLGYQDYLSVLKAQLIIKPVSGSYSPTLTLPLAANLALTNEINSIGTQLPFGSGNLKIDYLYETNTAYTYDITFYIQQALLQGPFNNAKNGMILYVPSPVFNTTFNRAVIGDAYNSLKSNQISLVIYYASYY